MKAISKRAAGQTEFEGSSKSNTIIIRFSADDDEKSLDIFGVKLSDIPKDKWGSKPDEIFCKAKWVINTKENAIKFDSLSFGVNNLGENPHCEVDKEHLQHWLPMSQCGFNKNEVNETAILSSRSSLPDNYPRNAIVDWLKLIAYCFSR